MMKKNESSFWVANITKMNVGLADLNLTLKPYSSVNLLDKKHYQFTEKQLLDSSTSGSLYKKKNFVVIRKVAPEINNGNLISISNITIVRESKNHSLVQVSEEYFEELDIASDEDIRKREEQFAIDNAELDLADTLK